jgi:hypothetical protein
MNLRMMTVYVDKYGSRLYKLSKVSAVILLEVVMCIFHAWFSTNTNCPDYPSPMYVVIWGVGELYTRQFLAE